MALCGTVAEYACQEVESYGSDKPELKQCVL